MRTSSSPIRSPSKLAVQKRVDEQSDDSDAESSRLTYSPLSSAPTSPRSKSSEPPPPYYSPTYSAVASRDSTKYSSLMQYLDGELDESMQLQRGEEAFDDMSSMSLSPSKDKRHKFSSSSSKANVTQTFLSSSHRNSPSKSVKSSGRSYVWDDWQNDDKQNTHNTESYGIDDEETNGDNTTYFSFAASRGGGTSSQKSHDGVSMGSKSIQHVVNEIKVKVDTMKGELENKHVRIRELQSELIRLNTAKNRRAQKFKSVWEAKLTAQREEQSAALKKTMDFVERIGHDVKQLNLKRDGLKEKHSRLSAHRETAIQILQDEMQRKVQRARRQWEVEEKAVFDKVLKGKEESLKKAAAESFGPALDKMVIDGKEAVRARTDECNKKLDRIKRELAAEVHEKIHQTRESLKNQMKMDDEKSRRVGERKLDDVLRKQSEELEAIKLKFARNRKLAEENAERTRRIDAETSLEALREVRKAESQQVLDLMASQQRELDQLVRNHADRIVSLKDGLNKREAEYCDKLTKELDAANSIHINRAKSSLTARYNAETEKVVAKLREEISGERKTVRDRIEAELDELRISAQNRLDAMQVSENRAIERIASLRGEIESYRRELSNLEEEQSDKTLELGGVRKQMSSLRLELANVKEEGDSIDHKCNEERHHRKMKFSREEEKLLTAAGEAEKSLSQQEVQIANKKEDARAMYASDLTRIRDKVASLLTKKDVSSRELRKQLSLLQQRVVEIEAELDESRIKSTLEIPSTLEEAMNKVGVPPRKGRSFIP